MLGFLSFAVVCGLATAAVCPGAEVPCGEGQTCCFANGRFTCCDLVDDPRIVSGSPSLAYLNSSSSVTSAASISKADKWDPTERDYCPYKYGKRICCDQARTLCIADSDCCDNKNCCYRGSRCCGNGEWCCTLPLKCGTDFLSCTSGAAGVYPVVGLMLAAIATLLFNGKSISS